MKKTIKQYKDLPYEEGKVYKTKFQTGESFLLKKVVTAKDGKIIRFDGIYLSSPDIGVCPLGSDRLIADRVEDGEIEVYGECMKPL